MTRLKHLPPHLRPREKLLEKGAQALSDDELLAALLGRGSRNRDALALGRRLLKAIDENGLGIHTRDITKIQGIGPARAAAVAAAFEFSRRRIRPRGQKIKKPADVLPLIRHYGDRKQEHFISISLNGANEVISVEVVTIGLVNKSQVHPREVFAGPISKRAAALVIAHNHPSADLTPSPEDIRVTQRLERAGRLLGIPVLDHLIFHETGFYSFEEHDRIPSDVIE